MNAAKNHTSDGRIDADMGAKALPVVLRILDKWECTQAEKTKLLDVSRSTLHNYQKNPEKLKLSGGTLERMSYILNIHKCLRIMFESSESVYGWVRKPNSHPFFNGRSAMDVMLNGNVTDLWQVASRLNAWRGGRS